MFGGCCGEAGEAKRLVLTPGWGALCDKRPGLAEAGVWRLALVGLDPDLWQQMASTSCLARPHTM